MMLMTFGFTLLSKYANILATRHAISHVYVYRYAKLNLMGFHATSLIPILAWQNVI